MKKLLYIFFTLLLISLVVGDIQPQYYVKQNGTPIYGYLVLNCTGNVTCIVDNVNKTISIDSAGSGSSNITNIYNNYTSNFTANTTSQPAISDYIIITGSNGNTVTQSQHTINIAAPSDLDPFILLTSEPNLNVNSSKYANSTTWWAGLTAPDATWGLWGIDKPNYSTTAYVNSTNTSMKGYVDANNSNQEAEIVGKEPTITSSTSNTFWNGLKQFVTLSVSNISDYWANMTAYVNDANNSMNRLKANKTNDNITVNSITSNNTFTVNISGGNNIVNYMQLCRDITPICTYLTEGSTGNFNFRVNFNSSGIPDTTYSPDVYFALRPSNPLARVEMGLQWLYGNGSIINQTVYFRGINDVGDMQFFGNLSPYSNNTQTVGNIGNVFKTGYFTTVAGGEFADKCTTCVFFYDGYSWTGNNYSALIPAWIYWKQWNNQSILDANDTIIGWKNTSIQRRTPVNASSLYYSVARLNRLTGAYDLNTSTYDASSACAIPADDLLIEDGRCNFFSYKAKVYGNISLNDRLVFSNRSGVLTNANNMSFIGNPLGVVIPISTNPDRYNKYVELGLAGTNVAIALEKYNNQSTGIINVRILNT